MNIKSIIYKYDFGHLSFTIFVLINTFLYHCTNPSISSPFFHQYYYLDIPSIPILPSLPSQYLYIFSFYSVTQRNQQDSNELVISLRCREFHPISMVSPITGYSGYIMVVIYVGLYSLVLYYKFV